ncbi:hypothetical protein SAMN05216464_1258 [Mucilaginibacter pineti]|uniref:Uncharacterized protein n=1 Tax=Mucilaginibacter pineti TaxID=1391627 RepID=A0A1G7N701_9SPHI|nr:hypothetical protein [Mucilaginibacter pineti]SDF69736.1 hypothetical protein SAMN05216464_1258 [Mucilaginibacter pineti]
MFRKLHSNRDPRDTLFRELKKEFSVYFGKAESGITASLRRYPKQAYGAMVVLMLVSLVLSFTIFRHREPAVSVTPAITSVQPGKPTEMLSPVSSGFGQILRTTFTLRQTLELKQQIDTLLTKRSLTAADSTRLATALDRLQHLQQSITIKP